MFTVLTTKATHWPVFHYPKNKTFISFKVKTSQNALIHLSELGTPNDRGNFWEVRNAVNMIVEFW